MSSDSAQALTARARRAWSSLSNACDDLAEISVLDLHDLALVRDALSVVQKVVGARKVPRWGEKELPFLGKKRGRKRTQVDDEQGESDLSDWAGMERRRTTEASHEKRQAKKIVLLLEKRAGPWSVDEVLAAFGDKATKQMVLGWLGVGVRRKWIRASGRGSSKRWSRMCDEGTVTDIRPPPPPLTGAIVSVLLEDGTSIEKRLRAGRLLGALSVGRRVLVRTAGPRRMGEMTQILCPLEPVPSDIVVPAPDSAAMVGG